MGGDGSGRWGWHRVKADTDGLPRLDVRWLARQGSLAPNASGLYSVAWSRGDRPAGDILLRSDAEIDAREHAALASLSAESDALVARLERRYGPLPRG